MCSKCYRESQAASEKEIAGLTDKSGAPEVFAEAKIEISPKPELLSQADAEPVEMVEELEMDGIDRPVQANRGRCFSCSKKVGLLGFECRCGYVYCSHHRHAADHSCSFDYASMDRERLAKANPTVAAAKVDKL